MGTTPRMPTLEAAVTTLVVLSPVPLAGRKKRRCQQKIKIDSWNHVFISPFMFTQTVFQNTEIEQGELQFQQDEDHKNSDRMSELANKLQQKIKTYKKQIEEAEEIAALNLAKYRKAQQGLEEAEERA